MPVKSLHGDVVTYFAPLFRVFQRHCPNHASTPLLLLLLRHGAVWLAAALTTPLALFVGEVQFLSALRRYTLLAKVRIGRVKNRLPFSDCASKFFTHAGTLPLRLRKFAHTLATFSSEYLTLVMLFQHGALLRTKRAPGNATSRAADVIDGFQRIKKILFTRDQRQWVINSFQDGKLKYLGTIALIGTLKMLVMVRAVFKVEAVRLPAGRDVTCRADVLLAVEGVRDGVDASKAGACHRWLSLSSVSL